MSAQRPLAILVHGLWMHGVVMEMQRFFLEQQGFDARCYSYASVEPTLTENANRLAAFARAQNATTLHWLGHSLGGLVILRMLECAPDLPPGRIVLAGTPSRGSYAARELSKHQLGEMAIGRSLAEWLAREDHGTFPGREIGVIAGSNGFGLGMFVAPELPEPNDGAVAVEETKLPAACDHIVLPVSHSGMLISHALANQVAAFWHNGSFTRETAAA